MKRNRSILTVCTLISCILLLLAFLLSQQSKAGKLISKSNYQLGTIVTISLYENVNQKLRDDIYKYIDDIEKRMSYKLMSSEISAINSRSGKGATQVSEDTFMNIERAINYSRLSDGKFDPTIGPLIDLWTKAKESNSLPSESAIANRLTLVDANKIKLDRATQSVSLLEEGMKLDLGAIVKGYIADEIVALLDKKNVENAVISLGGNVFVKGRKADGQAWIVGIQNPLAARGSYIATIDVVNETVVASGIYEKFFSIDGENYHHILDPKTGYPVINELLSVTVISSSSMEADAYSTLLFTLGLEVGLQHANKHNIKAIFIDKKKCLHLSNSVDNKLTLSNHDFKIAP